MSFKMRFIITGMTDDYFIYLHHYLFPESQYQVRYIGYFDELFSGV